MTNYLPKILITGGQGQLASAIKNHELLKQFNAVFYTRAELDITDYQTVEQALLSLQPDILINTAAYTAVDLAETHREQAQAINVQAVKNLARACQQQGTKFFHLSTDYVFAGNQSFAYGEDDTPHPINYYGYSKWQGEKIIQQTMENYFILRVSGLFSEYGHNFVKTILRLSQEKKVLNIVNDQITCPTSAGDIAKTILIICQEWMRNRYGPNGIYHYCSAPPVSWYDFALHMQRLANLNKNIFTAELRPISSAEYHAPATRPAYSVLACHKIFKDFGIAQPDWQSELQRVITCLSS